LKEIIFISIAHSSQDHGARNDEIGIDEYWVSTIASKCCYDFLASRKIKCIVYDNGGGLDKQYAPEKREIINKVNPYLAIEIHCNASTSKLACYSEVLYKNKFKGTKPIAENIALSINSGVMGSINKMEFNNHGIRLPDEKLFFLDTMNCPSIIVEGFFISNDNHAKWLKNGGAEAYGMLVGEGIYKSLTK